MNIFILDYDVNKNVSYYNDIHLNKMLLESLQILCSVHHKYGTKNVPYKQTHINHPCVQWAGLSLGNYNYLLMLAGKLEEERIYRGFKPSDKMQKVIIWCNNNKPAFTQNYLSVTKFVQAMPEKYFNADTVQAYRDYYVGEKQGYWTKSINKRVGATIVKWKQSSWTKRGVPEWFELDMTPRESEMYFND